jgi:hypothetical protein
MTQIDADSHGGGLDEATICPAVEIRVHPRRRQIGG